MGNRDFVDLILSPPQPITLKALFQQPRTPTPLRTQIASAINFYKKAFGAAELSSVPVAAAHGWRRGRLVDPFGHHREIARPLP